MTTKLATLPLLAALLASTFAFPGTALATYHPPSCPFSPQEGRTIVSFDTGSDLLSNNTEGAAMTSRSASLAAGNYRVSLAAWNGYAERVNASQPHEQYVVKLKNGGSTVATSNATSDLADNVAEASWSGVVNSSLSVASAIDTVVAYHAYYPDTSSPNSLVPLCAAFDRIDTHDECPNIPGDQPDGYQCNPPTHDEPVCALSASDTSIEEGDSTTLHWTSENAVSALLSGFGSVATGGSRTVSPTSDTSYTLTVRDDDGDERTCSVHINVDEDEDDEDPWCRITASDRSVEEGDRITLEWDTRNADEAHINQGIGRVDEDGGEKRVTIDDDDDVTFRMTVEDRDGDEDTCSVTVRVDRERDYSTVVYNDDPVYTPPVVYLSDIPYTGLEDIDPTILSFWMLLIAAAAAGTWFAYRGGYLPTFAFASATEEAEGHAEEAPEIAADAQTAESRLLAALAAGDADGAVDVLRDAAVSGEGVEEVLARAEAAASGELKSTLAAALAASRLTGIRGAKEAFAA